MSMDKQGIRERFKKKFAGVHDVRSWAYENCQCDDGDGKCEDKIVDFFLAEIESILEEKRREVADLKETLIKKGEIMPDESSMTWRVLNRVHSLFTTPISDKK